MTVVHPAEDYRFWVRRRWWSIYYQEENVFIANYHANCRRLLAEVKSFTKQKQKPFMVAFILEVCDKTKERKFMTIHELYLKSHKFNSTTRSIIASVHAKNQLKL